MSNLANSIENHIKRLLDASPNATILLQRKELAERFQCVPSQINYVLTTRFTPERGYLVESRRGGGGFLRIRRLDLSHFKVAQLIEALGNLVGKGLTVQEAFDYISRLTDARLVTRREGQLMIAVIGQEIRQVDESVCEDIRVTLLVRMLEALLHDS